MFAIYLYHKEEKERRRYERASMQGNLVGFYQAALAQYCIFSDTLIYAPTVLSPRPAMSNSILCHNEGILYLHCPLDTSGYLNLLKQSLKLFPSHVAHDY